MANIWIDDLSFTLKVGDVGFLWLAHPEGKSPRYTLVDRPLYTNGSHQPRLHGWCGTTDNISRHKELARYGQKAIYLGYPSLNKRCPALLC